MINESIHKSELVKKGNCFLKIGSPCNKIGKIKNGILRGFVYDDEGNEITTHFYQENDMVIGSFIPKVNMNLSIEALEDCKLEIADYAEVMSYVNKDKELTEVITREFQKLNKILQSRLVSLLNLDSVEKYKLFMKEYPSLINRIPHYYIANYLGITPTQLSRARKQFTEGK